MLETIRALYVLTVVILLTIPLIPVQWLLNLLKLRLKRRLPMMWHRIMASVVGLKVKTFGTPTKERPLLIVSNHISWLDILVLSSVAPVCFVAKQEVSGWPGVSILAKLQRTVFVDRERRAKTGTKTSEIAQRLKDGDAMVLFAEGTSTNGTHVMSFRPALFGAAQQALEEDSTVKVQPVAIAYTHLQGIPTTFADRAHTGFYGDTDMAPHLWAVIKKGGIDAAVQFGSPLDVTLKTNRKVISRQLHHAVKTMKTELLRGK